MVDAHSSSLLSAKHFRVPYLGTMCEDLQFWSQTKLRLNPSSANDGLCDLGQHRGLSELQFLLK